MNKPPDIVLVEDEVLTDDGCTVLASGSAEEALSPFKAPSDVRVLFTDVETPRFLDRLGLAQLVHRQAPEGTMPPKAPTEIDQLVGRRVREQRLRVGLSQAKLAQLLGITVAQLHKYETGVNRIGASRLHQIARLLQVPVGFFFEAQEGADASRADVDGTQVTDQQTSELVKAFSRITNSAMRRALLDLARAAAHSEETSSDKTSSKP